MARHVVEIAIPRWRTRVAVAIVHVARAVHLVHPPLAFAIVEVARDLVARGVRDRAA